MTRQEILENYDVTFGFITTPGKFEGEPIWAPYFWEAFLNGEGDEDETGVSFPVLDTDVEEFPELDGLLEVRLTTSSDGFVYCEEF